MKRIDAALVAAAAEVLDPELERVDAGRRRELVTNDSTGKAAAVLQTVLIEPVRIRITPARGVEFPR